MTVLEQVVRELPPELQSEVVDFARYLLTTKVKRKARAKKRPAFRWAGALRDLREQYTAVSLQHALNDWRLSKP
jgi:hypothetical protein